VTRFKHVRAGAVGVVALLALTLVAHAAVGAPHAARHVVAGPTPQQRQTLRALALEVATDNGDSTPTAIHVVPSTFKSALAADTGATAPSDADVFMVSMHGTFVGNDFDAPRGQPKPTGDVLTFEVDAGSGAIVAMSIGPIAPAMSNLGTVEDLN
jgi:hypothetical protein